MSALQPVTWTSAVVVCDGCRRHTTVIARRGWVAVGCFDWCPGCWSVLEADWHTVSPPGTVGASPVAGGSGA